MLIDPYIHIHQFDFHLLNAYLIRLVDAWVSIRLIEPLFSLPGEECAFSSFFYFFYF